MPVADDRGNQIALRRRIDRDRGGGVRLARIRREAPALVRRPLLVAERLEALFQIAIELLVKFVGFDLQRFFVRAVAAADDVLAQREEELAQAVLAPLRLDELERRVAELIRRAAGERRAF